MELKVHIWLSAQHATSSLFFFFFFFLSGAFTELTKGAQGSQIDSLAALSEHFSSIIMN